MRVGSPPPPGQPGNGRGKTDKQGRTVYTVGLSATDATGRVELVNVNVSGEPDVTVGQIIQPAGLVGFTWERVRNGQLRWGISYRADSITIVTSGTAVAA